MLCVFFSHSNIISSTVSTITSFAAVCRQFASIYVKRKIIYAKVCEHKLTAGVLKKLKKMVILAEKF